MRYTPNDIKLWFFIKFIRNLIAKMATTKEARKPIPMTVNWSLFKAFAFLYKSSSVAASIVGTASKKENSTITFLRRPNINPPIIVAADLETPGITAMD